MDDERASELAWQLAQLEAVPGDPHLFSREAALREHLYWVLDQSTLERRIQRGFNAALSGRLAGELRLQRMHQTLLKLGNDEETNLADLQHHLFQAANYAERTWLGTGVNFETSAGLYAIEDPVQQNRFARLVRRGLIDVAGPKALALKHARQRRRAAYLMGYGILAWMLLMLWAMWQQGNVEASFIFFYLLGTVLVAAWSTRKVLLALSVDTAAVAAANQGLRPRRVRSSSTTRETGPESH